ncbi:SET domain-containing protein [Pseudovirgaria hyperparasitica]|uniref:SET domain-containing protein n=1 Tax=Pseudovirgaria hyperparasitica TaxID=470096 RepID=A0A6A6WEX4_9PEZI|nr:SET domain-containing protein [Pseudovirgaria hyperparasitica]KAF2761273.1 SET domain-containing protein [Pseudovirgaria hyperparasitica]
MDHLKSFLNWSRGQGLVWDGIDFKSYPGRGTGVIATRNLKKGEIILTAPFRTYRTLDTLSPQVSDALSDLTLHARLAADLSLDNTPGFKLWTDMLPSVADLEASYPFFWPKNLQELLPAKAKRILHSQLRRYAQEWAAVSCAFPELNEPDFRYYWIIVNSRAFYLMTPSMEKLDPDDLLTLVPVADLFNHADTGVETTIEPETYKYSTDREYALGEEIVLCYAEESNDYLLTEYGFIPDVNKWDSVCLDDMILPLLNEEQKKALVTREYYGKYTITATTLGCWRTQVALRLICCTKQNWEEFVRGVHDGGLSQSKVDELLVSLLRDYQVTVDESLKQCTNLVEDQHGRREVLVRRWQQLREIVAEVLSKFDKKLENR